MLLLHWIRGGGSWLEIVDPIQLCIRTPIVSSHLKAVLLTVIKIREAGMFHNL